MSEKITSPLYMQIYENMLENILSEKWPADYKLPAEMELCRQYGVSRMTMRLAMDKLKNQGYLYRRAGLGTFVTVPAIEQSISSLYSFSEDILKKGHQAKSTMLSFHIMPCPVLYAQNLHIPQGENIYRIERILGVDSAAMAYEISYVPCALVPGLTSSEVEQGGLYAAMRRLGGLVPTRAEEVLEAICAGESAAHYLGITSRSPVLHVQRTTTAGGKIVEFCDSIVRGDRIKYRAILLKKPG